MDKKKKGDFTQTVVIGKAESLPGWWGGGPILTLTVPNNYQLKLALFAILTMPISE